MDWLNYHHLFYFWTVARLGSVSKASLELKLAQPTVSIQIQSFERALGEKLFKKIGRSLVLTEMGKTVFRYASEIFTLGQELQDNIKSKLPDHSPRLLVGVVDVLPKLIAYQLLKPAFQLSRNFRIICREDSSERLLAKLSIHELDLVLSDSPISSNVKVKAYNHLLGECGVSFFGSAKQVQKYRKNFPLSLHQAPFLLPTENTSLRRSLDHWFFSKKIQPTIVGEFEDSALLTVVGQQGWGIFPAPSILEGELRKYGMHVVARTEEIQERFYAISVERKLKHPMVVQICESAREKMFM